jgi:hypothetical protein
MSQDITVVIEQLEELGFTVLAYHQGRFKLAGQRGWKDFTWADSITKSAS